MQYLKDLIYDVCLLSPVNIRNYEFKSCVEKKKRVFYKSKCYFCANEIK